MNKAQESSRALPVAKAIKDLDPVDVPWVEYHVMVTGKIAATLLATERANRAIKKRKVNGAARDMVAGKWRMNGTAAKLDEHGHLIDGGHRFRAVVLADESQPGIRVPMTIQVGVPLDYRPTFDTGTSRSFADVLRLDGAWNTKSPRTFSSTVRYIALYMVNALDKMKGVVQPTHEELTIILEDKDTAQVLRDYMDLYAGKTKQPSVCGFVYWRAVQDDADLAAAWIAGVMAGTNMAATDPRFRLRERFVDGRAGVLDATESMALAIKSWNMFQNGEDTTDLRWRNRGKSPEEFPKFNTDLDASLVARTKAARDRKRRNIAKRTGKVAT